jgi:hypothetical protein
VSVPFRSIDRERDEKDENGWDSERDENEELVAYCLWGCGWVLNRNVVQGEMTFMSSHLL